MLHITNGDAAAERIHQTNIPGAILPWRDVLHEGPVPARLTLDELREVRARFIAEQGWGGFDEVLRGFADRDQVLAQWRAHTEVVLWFEHDLYDQLQLIQVLDWFAQKEEQQPVGVTQLGLVCVGEYLVTLAAEQLSALYRNRRPVSVTELRLGRQAWSAFRSPDPQQIAAFLQEDLAALPFLEGALRRHLQQFSSVWNGLSRNRGASLGRDRRRHNHAARSLY